MNVLAFAMAWWQTGPPLSCSLSQGFTVGCDLSEWASGSTLYDEHPGQCLAQSNVLESLLNE
jgi:hypothetical protein